MTEYTGVEALRVKPADAPLHEELRPWREDARAIPELGGEPKGFRDLMWCPYLNEPAILEYRDERPWCVNCNGNFEATTHPFIGHVRKPRFRMTVADYIADYFAQHGIAHSFGIVGAGNVALFDAIGRRGFTDIVPVHHEQAAAQAGVAYWRTCGRLAPVLLTTGAGSANAITGVINAWMDGVPLLVISGNETSQALGVEGRIKGAQGYETARIAARVVKFACTVKRIDHAAFESYIALTETGRFGPVWLDFPRDVWGVHVFGTRKEAA